MNIQYSFNTVMNMSYSFNICIHLIRQYGKMNSKIHLRIKLIY